MFRFCLALTVLFGASLIPRLAHAQLELELGGRLQSNVRFRVDSREVGDFYDRRELSSGVERNEHILKLKLGAISDRFAGRVDADVVWTNYPEVIGLEDLSDRRAVEPVRIEAHAAFIEGVDVIVDGLDLRLGQQIVSWGVGDQFNPTNNLNANDLEDPLLFGTQQANLMARADFTVPGIFTLQAVVVPVFKPALLPRSGSLAIAAVDRLPHLDEALRWRIHAEAATALELGFPTVVRDARVVLPETSFRNMQSGLRLATVLGEQDVALSWYRGFSDVPQPMANFTEQSFEMLCDPADPTRCFDGLLETQVTLGYPRMQVLGLNVAGEVDLLGWISDSILPLGYRFELGVYLPREVRLTQTQGEIVVGGQTRPAGEYDYQLEGGGRPLVLDSTPYAKWVLGADYSFGEHVYLNLQWVHGLVDEVGAGDFLNAGYTVRQGSVIPSEDAFSCAIIPENRQRCAREIQRRRLGDYLVVGVDLKFVGGDLLVRLFNILDLTGAVEERYSASQGQRVRTSYSPFSADGFSAVLYPEIEYSFGGGFALAGGALVQLGRAYTKFGDPAAGAGTVLWTRGRFSF